MTTLFFLAVSLIGAGLQLALQRRPRTSKRIVEVFFLWLLAVAVGLQGLFGFFGHAFMADEVARSIGWPTGSPFQFEIAIANLAFGVLGILCIWIRGNFWYATGIGEVIFFLGAAYGHIVQWVRFGDTAPENAGIFLYAEIVTALLLLGVMIAYRILSVRERQEQQAAVPEWRLQEEG